MSAPIDRAALLSDCEYFCTELIRRLDALACREVTARRAVWLQAVAITKRVRIEVQAARLHDKRRRAREQRLQESRR